MTPGLKVKSVSNSNILTQRTLSTPSPYDRGRWTLLCRIGTHSRQEPSRSSTMQYREIVYGLSCMAHAAEQLSCAASHQGTGYSTHSPVKAGLSLMDKTHGLSLRFWILCTHSADIRLAVSIHLPAHKTCSRRVPFLHGYPRATRT